MYLIAIGLISTVALPSVAWPPLIVTFSYLTVDISLCWAVVDNVNVIGFEKNLLNQEVFWLLILLGYKLG